MTSAYMHALNKELSLTPCLEEVLTAFQLVSFEFMYHLLFLFLLSVYLCDTFPFLFLCLLEHDKNAVGFDL